MKILILNLDMEGVGYWRILSPHSAIHDDELEFEIRNINDHTLTLLNETYLKQFSLFVYNRKIPFKDDKHTELFFNLLKKNNIKIVYDIDDNWKLTNDHINYRNWKICGGEEGTITELKRANYITTTTPIFKKQIEEYNKNVIVLPNSPNLIEQQWQNNKIKSDKIRFLWGGGVAHLPDIRLFKKSFESFDKNFLEKCQLYLCGFDLRMKTTEGMVIANWNSNPWTFFEEIFTVNWKYVTNNEYRQWLQKFEYDTFNYGKNDKYINEFYQRRWTKPLLLFGEMYNEADVVLAPLKNSEFNRMKSQLKVLEAGAHHCPIIASNTGPYTIDDIEGKYDKKPKGFLINEDDKMGWYNKMKWFVDNPNAIEEYGNNLYEYVKENYSLEETNKKRIKFYKNILFI